MFLPAALRVLLASALALRLTTAAPTPAPTPALAARIVAGTPVSSWGKPEFPFIAAMENDEGKFLGCSGTILTATKIVTAAHCVHSKEASRLRFRAGSVSKESGGKVAKVAGYEPHPHYMRDLSDYDVAIVSLSEPLKLSPTGKIQRAHLVASGSPFTPGQAVEIAGWGKTWHTLIPGAYRGPRQLQKTTLFGVDHEKCKGMYVPDPQYPNDFIKRITDRMFCAQAPDTGACQGDSGGPVVDKHTRVLLGIGSWGLSCAKAAYPDVNTDFSHEDINKWIREQVEDGTAARKWSLVGE